MRHSLLLAVLILTACNSRERGGTVSNKRLAPCPIVVIPLDDALRDRVRVFGTGAPMTAAVVNDLKARGFTPIVPDRLDDAGVRAAAKAGHTRLVLCGAFVEWEPDLRLDLQISDIDSGALVSEAERVIGSSDIKKGAVRMPLLDKLARGANSLLIQAPMVADPWGGRASPP